MEPQSYTNHRRYVVGYHVVLFLLALGGLIGSGILLFRARSLPSLLLFVISLAVMLSFYYLRTFALRAQDRAIRAEESLRHYILTGEPLDPRLTLRQIVGLRFAADDEFVELARSAAEKGTRENDIKKSIQSWRPDMYRV